MSHNRVTKKSYSETEMDIANKRRKSRIPMKSKLHIIERYNNGDTLTNIARDYNCTPSAISYIVNTVAKKVATQVSEFSSQRPNLSIVKTNEKLNCNFSQKAMRAVEAYFEFSKETLSKEDLAIALAQLEDEIYTIKKNL